MRSRMRLRSVWLIARREYLERVRTRSFWLSTLILPIIFSSMLLLPRIAGTGVDGNFGAAAHPTMRLAIVTADRELGAAIAANLTRSDPRGFLITFESAPSPELRAHLDRQIRSREFDGYLWIDSGPSGARRAVFARPAAIGFDVTSELDAAVWYAWTERALAPFGIEAGEARTLLARVDFSTADVNPPSLRVQGEAAILMVGILVFVMFISLMSYGIMVMRAVLDEKSSRITEVLLCSTSADELMAGKVAGIGAVGVTQVAIWFVAAAMIAAASPIARVAAQALQSGGGVIAWFAFYYILGYLLYSSIYAAVGASFNSPDEAQQWTFVIMLPLVATTALVEPAIMRPDAPIVVAGSMIPFSAPVLMYARILMGHPPIWQIALSAMLLLAAVWIALAISARIYRVGILMYGKRPTLREIIKWLRYA
ncbi:MAG: ABC transporter permease [Candidatus Binataceae bacterium]